MYYCSGPDGTSAIKNGWKNSLHSISAARVIVIHPAHADTSAMIIRESQSSNSISVAHNHHSLSPCDDTCIKSHGDMHNLSIHNFSALSRRQCTYFTYTHSPVHVQQEQVNKRLREQQARSSHASKKQENLLKNANPTAMYTDCKLILLP